jgi:hypothetical protein
MVWVWVIIVSGQAMKIENGGGIRMPGTQPWRLVWRLIFS